jgi:hypothetical protein
MQTLKSKTKDQGQGPRPTTRTKTKGPRTKGQKPKPKAYPATRQSKARTRQEQMTPLSSFLLSSASRRLWRLSLDLSLSFLLGSMYLFLVSVLLVFVSFLQRSERKTKKANHKKKSPTGTV